MAYRDLTDGQFKVVKEEAARRCTDEGLTSIADFKRVGNEIIDALENGEVTFAELLP